MATPAPTSPPDLNAETYPFAFVQELLDEGAYFNLYDVGTGCCPVRRSRDGAIVGFELHETLSRFRVVVAPPSSGGLRAINEIGNAIATFSHRWMFVAPGSVARPDAEPVPCDFDTAVMQRFVMLDSVFTLGSAADSFRGFGTGRTEPSPSCRGEVHVYAVGTILDGSGRFSNCEGTYTYCGVLTKSGFRGSVLLRVVDPDEVFSTGPWPDESAYVPLPEDDVAYFLLSGRKESRESRTTYTFSGGQITGFEVGQQLRLVTTDCDDRGDQVRCAARLGRVAGSMTAKVTFNLLKPDGPGTAEAPVPFKSYNAYAFTSSDGDTIGSFDADGNEGRVFTLALKGAPGQQALRFGGFGPILNGRGCFAGVTGQMADNSVVGVFPHALTTTYVFRLFDPSGRYRLGPRSAR